MALPQDLIEQARHLATRDVAGRPRQANLRRAISSAYYSLFHFLVDQANRLMVGVGPENLALRALVARAFDHTAMKKVSSWFASSSLPPKLSPALGAESIPANLRAIAGAFVELQERRHWADYNLLQRFEREQVLLLIDQAEQAMQGWPGVQNIPATRLYLYALLIGERVRE